MTIAQIKKKFPILLFLIISIFTLACGEKSASTVTETQPDNTAKTIPVIAPINDAKAPDVWHRSSRPRVLLDKERLELTISRMYGDSAREPYSRWFNLIKQSEDNGVPVDLVNLALIYQATGDPVYKNNFLARMPKSGVPNLTELYAIDIMFDELPIEVKQSIMDRVASSEAPWYTGSVKQSTGELAAQWGYHDAIRVAPAFAYAAIFADTELEKNKDTTLFPFNAKNYLNVVAQQLSEDGYFWQIENRIAGDTKNNSALPGSKGGMYDNIGYDQAEESYSINLLLQHFVLTGSTRFSEALHDKYRATFYQNMEVPHTFIYYPNKAFCRKAQTSTHASAQIWNTQTSGIRQPNKNTTALLASLYQDEKMQYYALNGVQRENCRAPYNGMFWELIYFDDQLSSSPPKENPTAMYFNGPGIVSMRSDWSRDAAFAVFLAGEGISRRYEDANSFLISRKTEVISHAGARIRFNDDNTKHHWYHIRSASKNTLKIFDPDESFDINADGTTGELHSGERLVNSDNLGGQIFETSPSNKDGCYNTYMQCNSGLKRNGAAFPLDIYETANITKFEHVENGYTYTVGDASAAYTKKIEYFEREFLFLRPDSFIIFDRVKSTNPKFRKVWTIHTNDHPVVSQAENNADLGMKSYRDAQNTVIQHPENYTYIDTLLPKKNKTTIRGGDSIIIDEKNLSEIPVTDLDMARWLEIFVSGNDLVGSLTINGITADGNSNHEVVEFDGRTQVYQSGRPTNVTASSLLDATVNWQENQWQGYQVTYKYNQQRHTALITGNSSNMLYGDFIAATSYEYKIERPFANTYKHWQKINSITTSDMNIANIKVSVPHYFDTTDANGKLYSFAPHTDFKDDQYRLSKEIGRWNMNVEAIVPSLLDHFAHVISLKDPEVEKPTTSLIESENTYGVIVDQNLAVFSKNNHNLDNVTIEIPLNIKELLIANLHNSHQYYYDIKQGTSSYSLTLSSKPNNKSGVKTQQSSAMGLLTLNVD